MIVRPLRILVIGAGGLLGRALRRRASSARIVCVAPPRQRAELDRALSLRSALGHAEPDVVINAAAFTDVDGAESRAAEAYRANCHGAAQLAAACADEGLPLIHVSTDFVFDGVAGRPLTEGDVAAPLGVYGASKLAGEQAVRRLHPGATIVRTAWLYDDGAGFPSAMLARAERDGHLRVVADQSGSPTHADDLADGLLALARRIGVATGPTGGLYHLAGSTGTTRFAWVQALLGEFVSRTGRRVTVAPVASATFPTAARRPLDTRLDCARMELEYGIRLPDWRERLALAVHGAGVAVAATA
jgi:dTDP-4-dehydrorhamnose reductase